jgi:hypothetical protein
MAVKNLSTRVGICGRSAGAKAGHCAVEQSSYIERTKMYCEFNGLTFYPKYSEDLVYSEVMLPKNAPLEYKNPSTLWNSVENFEKASDAQLARTYKVDLPNEWTYELATEVMRDFVQRNFVDRGMCAQFAIHDSENKLTGQRNLHSHIMLTLRSIDELGHWMPKQKKIYLKDENGEKIPLIAEKTGLQKVDKQNRKQWKCATVQTNDWNSRENAKLWRKNLAETINAVNERIGNTENFWEHRSFKEQGLDIIPQIHLGEKASALERAGIHTARGDINRDIIARNAVIDAARAAYEKAKEGLKAVASVPASIGKAIKNEIIDVIRAVAKRNHDRLSLPIMSGKYLRLISNRSEMQDRASMEQFVADIGVTTFEELKAFKKEREAVFEKIGGERVAIRERMAYLESLLSVYKEYEPYIKNHKEQWELKGWERKRYERKHMVELAYYDTYRSRLKSMITEPDKKITAGAWRKELASLQAALEKNSEPYAEVVTDLASVEVLQHNKHDLERMLENESHKRTVRKDRDITI